MQERNIDMKKILGKLKSKKKVTIVILLVLCVAVGGVFAVTRKTAKASEAAAEGSTVVAVTKQDLSKNIAVSGTISSAATYNLASEVTGVQVKTVNVEVGDEVKAGDVLATLDASNLEKSLASAQSAAGITGQQNTLSIAEAERAYNNTVSGNDTAVARSQEALNTAKNAQSSASGRLTEANNAYNAAVANRDAKNQAVAAAQAAYDAAKAAYDAADPSNRAAEEAALTGAKEALTAAKTDAEAAEAAVAEAKAGVNAAQDNVTAANNGVTSAQQTLDDANKTRTKTNADSADAVTNSKLAAANSARTAGDAVTQAKEQLQKATIVAPADGVITALNVKVGDTYAGGTMIVLQDVSGFKVSATLGQYDISDVAKGLSAKVTTDTTGTEEMTGKVTFVSPTPVAQASQTAEGQAAAATAANNGYPIEITIDNPSDRLRIGMNAKVTIIIDTRKDALAIPSGALQQEEDGSYYVEVAQDADGNGIADSEDFEKIPVTQGLVTDYYVEVTGKDLKEGMFVVIPAEDLSDLEIPSVELF